MARKRKFLSIFRLMTVAWAALTMASLTNGSFLRAQSPLNGASEVRLPDESMGIDGIARALVSTFDQVDIVALGEAHQPKLDSDLRIAVVRRPDFAKKVRSIVVECGSTTEQSTLDRYIRGQNISPAQLHGPRHRDREDAGSRLSRSNFRGDSGGLSMGSSSDRAF